MKRVLFVLVLGLLLSNNVNAKVQPWEKRVFQKETADSVAFAKFVSQFAKHLTKDLSVPTRVLGALACSDLENQEYLKKFLSESNQELQNCVDAFIAFNELGVYNEAKDIFTPHEAITLTEFRKRAQVEGFFLPYEFDLVWAEAERINSRKNK